MLTEKDRDQMRSLFAPIMREQLRGLAAAHALQGMLARPNSRPTMEARYAARGIERGTEQHYAAAAVAFADALLQELERS